MRMMICIPIDIDCNTTARKEIRAAMRRELINIARGEQPGEWLRGIVDDDTFVIRAPETPKAQ
jgi:hypothetical protein